MLDRSNMRGDPLSDILSLLKPRDIACGAIDAGDACISFPAGGGIKCHAVTTGEAWLDVDGVPGATHLVTGDCFILPHGRAYRLASDLALAPTDYRTVLAARQPGQIASWNGGGRATIVSATFIIEERFTDILLDVLPAVAHVREGGHRSSLSRSLDGMMAELREPRPGSRLIVQHLATTILAQALRAYAEQVGRSRVGWLFALADQQIGVSIAAIHDDPAHRWTVQALAAVAGMSRTSFAIRFKASVGSTPMNYLTQLRMLLASDLLVNSGDAISNVAEALGYESESAFSSAFKRKLGCSPRRYARGCLSSSL